MSNNVNYIWLFSLIHDGLKGFTSSSQNEITWSNERIYEIRFLFCFNYVDENIMLPNNVNTSWELRF